MFVQIDFHYLLSWVIRNICVSSCKQPYIDAENSYIPPVNSAARKKHTMRETMVGFFTYIKLFFRFWISFEGSVKQKHEKFLFFFFSLSLWCAHPSRLIYMCVHAIRPIFFFSTTDYDEPAEMEWAWRFRPMKSYRIAVIALFDGSSN